MSGERRIATLAGGCFWCLEAVFEEIEGVEEVRSGYTGGHVSEPTYEEVSRGTTGHAEAVQIVFDPEVVSYRDLLEIFFAIHDPTTPNRQGADVGPQYRSAIFTHSQEQREEAEAMIAELERERVFDAPIVTEIAPFTTFWPAEDYHREYYRRNPRQAYCQFVIAPKLAKARERFRDRLKHR